jgi:hypothetical protein
MAKKSMRRWTDEQRHRHGLAMRKRVDARREARSKRGGLSAKEVIFERWLQSPLLDPDEIADEFSGEVSRDTVLAWLNSWLRGGKSSPGYPASANGRENEIQAALRTARKLGIRTYRLQASSKRTTAPPPAAPEAVDMVPSPPDRVPTTVHRIIRDTELARRVKMLHQNKCQICGHTIKLPDGSYYAEAHHVQPLGQPHNGPDEVGNIVCVCPNHHAELDYGAIRLSRSKLAQVDGHVLGRNYLNYHNAHVHRSGI